MDRETFHERCARLADLFQQKRIVDNIMHDTKSGRCPESAQVKYPVLIRVIQNNPAINAEVFDALAEIGVKAHQELLQVEKLLNIDPE